MDEKFELERDVGWFKFLAVPKSNNFACHLSLRTILEGLISLWII